MAKGDSLIRSNDGNSRKNTFLNVAAAEEWYLEKASPDNLYSHSANPGNNNWTKYGYWGWHCSMAWCAAFVSWCGNQAGLSTSIIPKTVNGSVADMRDTFSGWGRYHTESSYVPVPGDIFIQKDATHSHTGIVVSSSSSAIYVIDGNGHLAGETYDRVKYHYINRSEVTGYGNPNWCYGNNHSASGIYQYVSSNIFVHWEKCSCCGQWVEEDHNWMDYVGHYKCTECGMISGTIPSKIGDSND